MSLAVVLVAVLTTILVVFLVLHSFQALLLAMAVPELWSHWQLGDDEYFLALIGSDALPPVSVVAPAAGAGDAAVPFATMLLALDYPRHEVVLVADSADAATFDAVGTAYDLYAVPPAFSVHLRTAPVRGYFRSRSEPRLLVVDIDGHGRADAMNAGLNAARYPHALVVHHGMQLERDALLRLTRPFLISRNVAAVGGTLRPADGDGPGAHWLRGVQRVEYLRAFLFQRLGWNRLASNLLFPGPAVLFKREHVVAVGGFRAESEEPALDLAVRLHRYFTSIGLSPRMPVIPDAAASTAIPDRWSVVRAERQRWQRGLLHALAEAAPLTFDPAYGGFGLLVLPYFWLALVVAPVLELAGYLLLVLAIAAGAVSGAFVVAYLAAVVGYGMLLSVWTVVLGAITDRPSAGPVTLARLLVYAVAESIGFRQRIAWYRATAFRRSRSHPSLPPVP